MVDAVEPLVIRVSITPVIEPLAPSRSAPARSEIASSVPLTLSREVSKVVFQGLQNRRQGALHQGTHQ